jgi:hypothetical protein
MLDALPAAVLRELSGRIVESTLEALAGATLLSILVTTGQS